MMLKYHVMPYVFLPGMESFLGVVGNDGPFLICVMSSIYEGSVFIACVYYISRSACVIFRMRHFVDRENHSTAHCKVDM